MSNTASRKSFPFDNPGIYRIRVHGFLDESWSERLGGMKITKSKTKARKEETILTGLLVDQAELAGVLNTLYEWHLPLLSVKFLGDD